MRVKTYLGLGLVTLLSLGGCSDDTPPVKIESKVITSTMFGGVTIPVVELTAIVDEVEVQDLIGNRGNCKINSIDKQLLPKKLQYGQKIKFGFVAGCTLSQIDVVTDQGKWSVNY
ncbi:MAG: hypothetical protein KU37_10840 [Sulfuricurvum sp. PC08-66]|nr:MAG: hypothetical protein KU37_10840 [Sulfuricurvum sp. PC08-66]